MKADQGFGSKIISEYAERHRFQKKDPTDKEKIDKSQYEQYANYNGIKGKSNRDSMSEEDLKKIKENKPNFKIGFSEDTPA